MSAIAERMQRKHELVEARNELERRRSQSLRAANNLAPDEGAWIRGYARGLADAVHLLEEVIER